MDAVLENPVRIKCRFDDDAGEIDADEKMPFQVSITHGFIIRALYFTYLITGSGAPLQAGVWFECPCCHPLPGILTVRLNLVHFM